MKGPKLFIFSILSFLLLLVVSSWGFLVHRTTAQVAIYQLPKGLQPFFYENKEYLVRHSVRPDVRRNNDKTEAPKHYISLEGFGDSAAWKLPKSMSAAMVKFGMDTLVKYGYVPYWVMVTQERLTQAFRTGNKDSILFYAADLAHYIGDANVPLHTTTNYDGQLTGQKGLHSLWESAVPEIELKNYNLYNRHKAKYINDTEAAIWTNVRQAHVMVAGLLSAEREATAGFTDSTKYRVQMRNGRESRSYTTAFARAYSQKLNNTVNQQLLITANQIADFWYTAWVNAGKPKMDALLKDGFSKEEKKDLKGEYKSFKKNKLLADSLLLSKRPLGNDND